MPPQQTDISPGIEVDAAKRGLNLAIVSAKDTIDQALVARLKASAKALDKALDKDAAGPAAAPRRSVLAPIKRAWLAIWERHQRPQVNLQDLSDRELRDIGLTRSEVDYLTPQRAIDALRDHTRYLWNRGGM
ncbi:DUF1127 domain-containing protein [Bradyrhizobium sp. INPA01-394B]|uniref:DUF1127 domain-containing protein n=1 Tax=Bradyrhizobium campsiandrae TaxID=1729892 RepID=A0ABR7U066_9BRAD|nr:DUF1127 domain-containing protein [Bradyrhizobium campsiandrae]MBC9877452.1 DUF1127 domain-containing protein [Bradyrhizobium campsiandrae]MBC9976829.1 DUF1127 domain-containing protein [Bradyrhizobium campsiandrae]